MVDTTAVVAAETHTVAMVDMGGAMMPLDAALTVARAMKGAVTLPKHWASEADLTAAVLTAMQWRVPLMTVIRGCHMIEGRVSPSAELLAGIARGHGHITEWHEEELTNPVGWRVYGSAKDGTAFDVRFTVVDAQKAGLLKRDNWVRYERDMCRARAISRAASRACPMELAGIYSEEELEKASPQRAARPQQRQQRPEHDGVVEAEFVDEQPATTRSTEPATILDPDAVALIVKGLTDSMELDTWPAMKPEWPHLSKAAQDMMHAVETRNGRGVATADNDLYEILVGAWEPALEHKRALLAEHDARAAEHDDESGTNGHVEAEVAQ